MGDLTKKQLFNECNIGTWNEDKDTDTQWALRDLGNGHFLLVFPPTQSDMDWKQNFRFLAVPYKNMPEKWTAHAGFLEKYHAIRDDIFGALLASKPRKLTITGYSQGGALGTLSFEDIKFNLIVNGLEGMEIEAIVFGCPRVVSWNAPSERWAGLVRVNVRGDIVPHVPFVLMGYKHVGHDAKIGPWSLHDPSNHAKYYFYLED